VPSDPVQRDDDQQARWLLAQAKVSDAELDYLATGKLPEP